MTSFKSSYCRPVNAANAANAVHQTISDSLTEGLELIEARNTSIQIVVGHNPTTTPADKRLLKSPLQVGQ